MVDALFSCSGETGTDSRKKRVETRCATLVFLHPVGYVGLVVHFCASEARNIDTLFFLLRWNRHGFHKNCALTRYTKLVFLHPVGYAGHLVYFGASGT
jgi:hypothetical protein